VVQPMHCPTWRILWIRCSPRCIPFLPKLWQTRATWPSSPIGWSKTIWRFLKMRCGYLEPTLTIFTSLEYFFGGIRGLPGDCFALAQLPVRSYKCHWDGTRIFLKICAIFDSWLWDFFFASICTCSLLKLRTHEISQIICSRMNNFSFKKI